MFRIDSEDDGTNARTGILRTGHGEVRTPAFLPVATKGVVKTLDSHDLEDLDVQALIVNAFHLWIRGIESVENAGGLHKFMGWKGPIFTDSGGFQIIRKDFDFKVTDEGFLLKSPVDGKSVTYSPETCMDIHSVLGSDVAFVLDDCPSYDSSATRLEESVQRTTNWAERSKAESNEGQGIFGIVQGGTDPGLRKRSAEEVSNVGFDGYGVGGLSIGEPKDEMLSALKMSISSLSKDTPKHMMGLGSPAEILESISQGVDIFDSAFPTRNARHGTFYTEKGRYDIRKKEFMGVEEALSPGCGCFACKNYSTSYIYHLYKEKEMLAYRLLSIHNLRVILDLVAKARTAIAENRYLGFKDDYLSDSSP